MLQLLLYMNGMGSLFFILYMLLLPIVKRCMPPDYQVFLYRLNLMFFVVPFPASFFYLRRYFDDIVTSVPVAPLINNGAHIIVHLEQNISFALPKLKHYEIIILLTWILVMSIKYKRFSSKNRKLREFNRFLSSIQEEQLAKSSVDVTRLVHIVQEELSLKTTPRIFLVEHIPSPHVSGIFNVTLCMPVNWEVSEQVYYMAIRHELSHVRHKDLLFQRIALIARIVSWFNPFLYILCSKMATCDELAADACACKDVSVTYRQAYQTALLTMAPGNDDIDLFAKGLNFKRRHNQFTKERILTMNNKNLYKHKFIKLVATAFISAVLFTMSTVPALAYNLPAKMDTTSLSDDSIHVVDIQTIPSEEQMDLSLTFTEPIDKKLYSLSKNLDYSKSDWYCIDENGVISNDTIEPRIIPCNHDYLAAQVSYHTSNSDGSCSVTYHKAKRCKKCGYIIVLEKYATTTYEKCPH